MDVKINFKIEQIPGNKKKIPVKVIRTPHMYEFHNQMKVEKDFSKKKKVFQEQSLAKQ